MDLWSLFRFVSQHSLKSCRIAFEDPSHPEPRLIGQLLLFAT